MVNGRRVHVCAKCKGEPRDHAVNRSHVIVITARGNVVKYRIHGFVMG